MEFITLRNQKELIDGIIIHPLKVNRDRRGILVETLKTNWTEVFGPNYPFGQNYYSITASGVARDEDFWHYHPNQKDRFTVIQGDIVVAVYDWRKGNPSYNQLNLFKMGESEGDDGQYLLLIPNDVPHGFCVVSPKSAILLNVPSLIYDPKEEGRIPHTEAGVRFPDGSPFSWNVVRDYFR